MDVVDLINFSTFSKSFNSTSWYSRLNFDLNINSNFNFELEHLILALLSYAILCYNELPYLCYLMLLYATMNFLIAENFAEGFGNGMLLLLLSLACRAQRGANFWRFV